MAITLLRNKIQALKCTLYRCPPAPPAPTSPPNLISSERANVRTNARRCLHEYGKIPYYLQATTSLSSCDISFHVQDFRASVSYLPSGRFSRIIQMKEKLCLIKALRCSFKDLWRLRWKGDSSRVVLSLRMIIEIWMGLIFTIKLKDWAGYWAGENRWVQRKRNYSTIGHTVHFPSVEQQYRISLHGNDVFSRPLNANKSRWF